MMWRRVLHAAEDAVGAVLCLLAYKHDQHRHYPEVKP